MIRLTASVALLVLSALSAFAADIRDGRTLAPVAPVREPSFFELRLGASYHEIDGPESGSVAIVGEVLTPKFFRAADPLADFFIPRLHVGASINAGGDTSFGYAGFTWSYDFTPRFFGEVTFGGAIHNGETGPIVPVGRNALGCSPLFRESVGLGYRITEQLSVMAVVEHLSNAGLCDANRGLTNAGLRLGYRF